MKAVILAGGQGTRISLDTDNIPKPMIKIGNMPILWHIMKIYSCHGINDFIICCGYKGYIIKEYFANYFLHMSDVTFNMKNNIMDVHQKRVEPWTVTLIDTGEHTMTGGRLKYIKKYIKDDNYFCLTYGDGVCDVNLTKLIMFHKSQKTIGTLTAVHAQARFGAIKIVNKRIISFKEKPKGDGGRINGGFFVLSPEALDLIDGDSTVWEKEPLEALAENGQISAYEHDGFWQPMDTLRDKNYLQALWDTGNAPWKKW